MPDLNMPGHGPLDNSLAVGEDLWRAALPALAERVGSATYEGFLKQSVVLAFDEGVFRIGVPSQFAKSWLEDRHTHTISAHLTELTQTPVAVLFEVRSDLAPEISPAAPVYVREVPPQDDIPEFGLQPLNPKYSFDNFVVADCNRFANAAAQQIAKSPGRAYNPLFIHSKVGLGKTHLMQAIGHRAKEIHPHIQVIYVQTESFVNQVISAIRDNRMGEFQRRYRYVDLWLVDDIQFIASREAPASEQEFFHTFNTLYEMNKQVVIASDCPPRQLRIMDDRLRSRLEMGIVADLRCPDVETRVAILEKKAETEGIVLPREVLEFMANKIESNIRVLEGALAKVCAYITFDGGDMSIPSVEALIADYSTAPADRRITLDEIVALVAEKLDCSKEEILGARRSKDIVWPRHVAIYLARELTPNSLADIGQFFGGRDHATVLHAYNKVADALTEDERALWMINELRSSLQE
jgi:chromosomal replication initiator protein